MTKDDKSLLIETSVNWFIENRHRYKKLCLKIESILNEILEIEKIPFHAINSRVKDVESFRNKISNDKYDKPTEQITDFSGIRIIAYVEDDVKKISNIIESIFDIDPKRSIDKSKNLGTNKVGYKSVHYIAKLKKDRTCLVEYKSLEGLFFEIQVRTILQHAWAEIEHDKNYKFSGKLPEEIARRFMLLAGSLEIADREFNNISKEIDELSSKVELGTKSGDLSFDINSTSLQQFVNTKFEILLNNGHTFNFNKSEVAIEELDKFGIKTLNKLNDLLSEEILSDIINHYLPREKKAVWIPGLIRLLLIISDYKKYFQKSYNKEWDVWNSRDKQKTIFDKHGVDWDVIEKEYNVKL
ncbi:GTP pyrophosphokinase family protein [Flavobacterium sp.]|jgi:putative GTP pyrophosphokinase|uniref:GTP pyrophosphokinase family protein n=1 Tax=Flavobacterium sp. TaxID=239 RepID=UPI003784E5E2